MQFKKGLSWKASFDEDTGRCFGEYGGAQDYHLYELQESLYNQLDERMAESAASSIMREGRHLYMAVNDRCGPPYTVVFDDDYRELCPWANIVSSGKTWPDGLTNAAAKLFEF